MDLGVNLAVNGLVLAILVPAGFELRQRVSRIRKVSIIDYRRHQFGQAVTRAAASALQADKRRWEVQKRLPPDNSGGGVQWQIEAVQHAIVEEVDAIILIPAGNDERLWLTLAAAIKTGVLVVAVDTKPPNNVFRELGLAPPRFVSSRYDETGVIIGRLIDAWLDVDPTRTCILWTGPEGSWPGEERSRNIIYELARERHLEQTVLYTIKDWVPNAERCRNTLKLVEDAPGLVAIYCADDENALALHLLTLKERPHLRAKMYIVGCNATPDEWGQVQAIGMHAVDVTVDILAEQQGVQAARLLASERAGRLSASERTVFIPPEPRPRVFSRDRWLDVLLEDSHEGEVEYSANERILGEIAPLTPAAQHLPALTKVTTLTPESTTAVLPLDNGGNKHR